MTHSYASLAGLFTVFGVACTTIIGLQDVPDPGPNGAAGSAGDRGAGSSGAGLAGAGSVDGTNGGSSNGGSSNGGSSNGGSSNGGSGLAGADDGSKCVPACLTGESCVSGSCECLKGLSKCTDGCFDLTTEKDHCSSCEKSCDSACSASRCYTQLAQFEGDEVRMALDASYVYFTRRDAGTVSRVPRGGGAVEGLAQGQDDPAGIEVDKNNIYWINGGANGSVQKLPLAGGSPVQLAAKAYLKCMAVDASFVYWTVGTTIQKVAIAGGEPVILVSGSTVLNTQMMEIDATHVYWVNQGDGQDTGSVMKVPKAGGSVVTLASGFDLSSVMAVYGGNVYFSSWAGYIRKVPVAGGTVTTLTATDGATALAVDASSVYAGGRGGALEGLRQLTLAGSTHAVLAALPTMVGSVAVDGNEVFWTDFFGVRSTLKVP